MEDETWTDQAVRSGDRDTLGRLPYARRAAQLIHATHSFESSAVFGLSGPWGSGKTSLVNMIVEELVKAHPKWAVARFTPWATSDVSGLLGEFYASLAEVLPKKKGQQVRRALAVTASVAAPAASLVPFAGGVAAEGVRAAGDALTQTPSWQVAFSKASSELKELKRPILVVVDDIDRLHIDELMALLKVVRLLGRFDGVQYLLAYDDETLYRSLTASSAVNDHDGSAERFMEKIVQYPLFVPPLLQHQQLSRLNAGLASVSRESENDASEHRLSGLVDCFVALLTTPRAIDRYVAQLRHHIPLLSPEEVDDSDVQLLTLVRVCFPALFNAIPRYRNGLISGNTGEVRFDRRKLEFEPFDIDPLLAVVPNESRGIARRLLIALFPKVRAQGQMSTGASQRRQSVQHEEYFDRYFAMGILAHDVSDAIVAEAVGAAIRGDAHPLTELVVGSAVGVRGLVLSKGISQRNQPSTDAGRVRLAEALARIASELPSDDSGPFSDQDHVVGWIADLLVAIDRNTTTPTVLAVVGQLAGDVLRIKVWRRLGDRLERAYRQDFPAWYADITAELVENSAAAFLEHLKQGDEAPLVVGVGYQVQFVLRHDPERLRSGVLDLLESQAADLSVLASRLVSARTITGIKPDWQLSSDFNQETYNQLAPQGDDPWYQQPVEEVDVRDLSWANRRKFAAGRVRPPSGPPTAQDDDIGE